MKKLILFGYMACLALATSPAIADDRNNCQASDPDLSIKGCSAVIASKNEPPDIRAIAYRNRGLSYLDKGQADRAIADYSRAIELAPDADAYHSRGNAYLMKGMYDRAIADYNRAIELNPKDSFAYSSRGNAYRGKGEYARALADYSRSFELNLKDPEVYYNRGSVYFDIGEFANASADFLHVIGGRGDAGAMLLRYLARARLKENAAPELEANASRLKSQEWPYAVIELYLGKRQPAAVLTAASKPSEVCQANFYIGEWHILQSRPADAGPLLRKVVETCPKDFTEYTAAQAELQRLKR